MVVVDGIRHEATVGNNGFFYELEGTAVPEALELLHQNGTTETIELKGVLTTPEQ